MNAANISLHAPRVFRHAHLFCGVGAGAKGFNDAHPRVGNRQARFECAGGIDVDPGAIRNFERMTGARGTLMDLFDREQYLAFHGREPGPDWREATPADIFAAFGPALDVAFLSAPCKGFSGLLSATQSKTDKYQALNRLTLRGVWLMLEAYKNDPIPIFLFENVPRIRTRGRWLLDQIKAIFRSYGYLVTESEHDCGEIGGLAQSRKRFLLVARRVEQIPNFVYEPHKFPMRGVGEVIGRLPLPGDPRGGPMHRVPSLQWRTWVRLSFVPAGRDWRALNELAVEDGALRDFGIAPEVPLRDNALGVNGWHDTAPLVTGARAPGQGRFSVADPRPPRDLRNGALGVVDPDKPAGTVQGESGPTNGAFAVPDPRPPEAYHNESLGVRGWDDTARVVAGASRPHNGAHSVADPRGPIVNDAEGRARSHGKYPVDGWDAPAKAVIGGRDNGAYAVADPRPGFKDAHHNVLRVTPYDQRGGTVTSATHPAAGALSVADPRPGAVNMGYKQYGVREWQETTGAVTGQAGPGGGANSVADPRLEGKPRFNNTFRIVRYDDTAPAVAGPGGPAGGLSVADPRPPESDYSSRKYKVTRYEGPSRAVIGASTTGDGAYAVADPRCTWGENSHRNKLKVTGYEDRAGTVTGADRVGSGAPSVADARREHYQTSGHYGVVGWNETAGTVAASTGHDNGRGSVADPRETDLDVEPIVLPAPGDRLVCRIVALDETWHRPFTTLELAALQSLFDPDEVFDLEANSDALKREWIGNAVPSAAARGMAETIGETLLLAEVGETFTLSSRAIWVKPLALALSVDPRQSIFGECI